MRITDIHVNGATGAEDLSITANNFISHIDFIYYQATFPNLVLTKNETKSGTSMRMASSLVLHEQIVYLNSICRT